MIDFRCPHCGREMCADDAHAGTQAKCPGCAQTAVIPDPLPTSGIRVESGSILRAAGGRAPVRELPQGRFRLAEAACRLWKKGSLAPPKDNHPVESLGLDGLTMLYGTVRKPGKLRTSPRRPTWEVGTRLEGAITVGAFTTPLRFLADVVAIVDRAEGPGCRVELAFVEIAEDARRRLEMLDAREDLRHRRRTGRFGQG